MPKKKPHRSAYPLAWPDEWPRTTRRGSAQFRTSLSGALGNVNDELRRFGSDSGKKVESLLISSNVTLADQRPADPGVAIYFTWDGLDTCIAVDRYERVEHNLQAIAKVIEAERTKLRHGGLNLVRAAFRGYAKLPPPSTMNASSAPWRDVLGVGPKATLDDVTAAYKVLRSKYHPDRPSGDKEKFTAVYGAYERALDELRP